MSRDTAAAIRSEPAQSADSLNPLLERQIAETRGRNGAPDLDHLLKLISAHYDRLDAERRGVVRSMQLMSDEAQAMTREIREQTAGHLQAILDNVKDAIITVDETGRIESFNHTGERIFGYPPAEILGRSIGLLPSTCWVLILSELSAAHRLKPLPRRRPPPCSAGPITSPSSSASARSSTRRS